jgi:hypothetical protein
VTPTNTTTTTLTRTNTTTPTVTRTYTPSTTETPTNTPTNTLTPTNTITQTVTPSQRANILADVLCNCSGNTSRNIYVFYDGSGSYEDSLLQSASESVRTWYSGLTNNSGWTGNLYEMVVWDERWISWPIYPIIGSLSGGTVGAYTINNGSLLYSGITNDTVVKQTINNGYEFGNFGNPDPYSQGVPFNHAELNNFSTAGNFTPESESFLTICVINESSPIYTQTGSTLTTGNTISTTNFFVNNTGVQKDYNNYLTSWNYFTNTLGKKLNNLLFVNPNGNVIEGFQTIQSQSFQFILESIALIEGQTRTSSYLSNYNFNGGVWPNINPELGSNWTFAKLETSNPFTTYTSLTGYTSLNSLDQNGAGLINFDWTIDPTVSDFSAQTVQNSFNKFFSGDSRECLYTDSYLSGLTEGQVVKLSGYTGCWEYMGVEESIVNKVQISWTGSTYNNCNSCTP